MGLESSFSAIDDLNADWPLGTDLKSDGDNHIRGVKGALKANVGGTTAQTTLKAGGTARVTVTATEAAFGGAVRLDGAAGRAQLAMDASGNLDLSSANATGGDAFQWAEFRRDGGASLMWKGSAKRTVGQTGLTVSGVLSGLSEPVAATDAATKNYVDLATGGGGAAYPSQLFFLGDSRYPKVTAAVDGADVTGTLRVNGGRVEAAGGYFTQPLVCNGYTVTGVGTPVISSDAANKAYVDTKYVLYLSDGTTPRVTAEAFGVRITGSVFPNTDGSGGNCGTDSLRWGSVYAVNGTINTSDERAKRDITVLTPAELRAARRLARMCRSYYWRDGPDQRRHFGVIAQEVVAVLESEDVDAHSLGLVQRESDRWGVNYGELAAFVAAGLEQELRHLEGDLARVLLRLDRLERAGPDGGAAK